MQFVLRRTLPAGIESLEWSTSNELAVMTQNDAYIISLGLDANDNQMMTLSVPPRQEEVPAGSNDYLALPDYLLKSSWSPYTREGCVLLASSYQKRAFIYQKSLDYKTNKWIMVP